MKNRLRKELEAMLELRTGDSFTADNVHTLVNGIFAADEGGGFKYVEYDDSAFPYPQTIGDTASSITGLGPAAARMMKTIFIMPNKSTNPDATLMIVVDEVEPPTDPKTYQYVYVGNINGLPSDVLTESSIVNIPGTELKSVMSQKGATDLVSEYNVSTNNNNTEYTFDQAVVLVPASLQKGGLTIKYIDSTTHEYAIKRLMSSTWNTTESNWQGIDNEPSADSENLVKSGGTYNAVTALRNELLEGGVIPAMAETLSPWADQKAIATPDTYIDAVRTTGGDIPVETSAGSKPESIKPVAGNKWTAKMLFNGSYNILNAAKWGAANSQPYVGGVGSDYVYFLVPELTLGTFGTADDNNGLLFTDSEGENVEPTSVYFKPLGATVPSSLTDGTSITPTSVSYDDKTYKDYATDSAGWIIIPKSYYDNDVCAHIAWEDWYDKHVSLNEPATNPEAVVGVLILEGLLALAHSDKYLRGINDEVCDNVVFGDTSATIIHMVDELSVAANAWTNAATGESDSQGNALYRHSASVSGIKQGGAACVEGEDGGIHLTVNGTTVSYVDTNATAPASTVFYEVTATNTTKAYTDNIFSGSNINTETGILPINDCSIEAQVAMDGKADITVKYAKNIVDQVAINATVDVPQIKKQVEEHEKRITDLEDTAVRTGSYDASVSVGLADNLRGDTVVNAEFYKRNTGGTQSVGSGIAAIKEMRGKSIVWNQLLSNGYFTSLQGWSTNSCSITLNEDVLSMGNFKYISASISKSQNWVVGHKYLFSIICKPSINTQGRFLYGGYGPAFGYPFNITGGQWNHITKVGEITNNISSELNFYILNAANDTTVDVKRFQVFDLTLMFGAGNEPVNVADFEKMFPLDYYDYNTGEIIPFAGQNLTTIGKNQYNPVTGKANLLGGQQYQITGTYTTLYPTVTLIDYTYGNTVTAGTYYTNGSNHFVGIKNVNTYDNTATYALGGYCAYDDVIYKSNVVIETAEEFDVTHWDVIADVAAMVTEGILMLWDIVPDTNGLFTLTGDMDITVTGGNDTDTMIATYDGENTSYEPYEKHTLPLDPSQWRDKNGDLVFPYGGMHGVGSVYDYAKVDADGYIRSVVRCFERVVIGDLTGSLSQSGGGFILNISQEKMATNIISSKYTQSNVAFQNWSAAEDKKIQLGGAPLNILIKDTSYSSWDSFKTANSNVVIIYQLKTPIEIELATPIYAKYLVDKDGTEEITPANSTKPYTTMANLSILYAMDARGEIKNLPKNYLSKESAESMLNAMVTAGIIASYTMTWDAANSRYVFTFVAPTPEPQESNE